MVSLEIDASIARTMLPSMKERLESLNTQIEGMSIEVKDLEAAIRLIEGGKVPTVSGEPRQRLQKGQAENIVFGLLKGLTDGQGLTVAEIARRTGVKYVSVHRALNKESNRSKFVCEKDKWRLKNK